MIFFCRNKGLSLKDVRSQGVVVRYGHFANKGLGGSSDADVRTFGYKKLRKLRIFRDLWCVRTDKGGRDVESFRAFCGEGGNFSRFCADVFDGRSLRYFISNNMQDWHTAKYKYKSNDSAKSLSLKTYPIKIYSRNEAVNRAPLLEGDNIPNIAATIVINDIPNNCTPAPINDTNNII